MIDDGVVSIEQSEVEQLYTEITNRTAGPREGLTLLLAVIYEMDRLHKNEGVTFEDSLKLIVEILKQIHKQRAMVGDISGTTTVQ